MATAIVKIITAERTAFSDFSFPQYAVAVLPKKNNIAGFSVPNLFMCYVDPVEPTLLINRLIAHEVLHVWLGNRLLIVKNDSDGIFRYHWFTEGFTDYLANKVLLAQGLQTPADFVSFINGGIAAIADNRYRAYSYAQLKQLAEAGEYGSDANKLQYARGALIAVSVEHDLNRFRQTLFQFVRALYDSTASSGHALSETALFAFAARRHVPLRERCEMYCYAGKEIRLSSDVLGSAFVLRENFLNAFDRGFSTVDSNGIEILTGLQPAGNAWQAGLRNGFQLIDVINYNRFGAFHKPIKVVVRDGGVRREIVYFPRSPEKNALLLFERK